MTFHSVVAVAVLVAAAGAAWGQPRPSDDGPIVVGERQDLFKAFDLRRFQAGVEFFAQQQTDHLRQQGQPEVTARQTLLRETLDIDGEAYIGHKNLIDLTVSGKLGLEDVYDDQSDVGLHSHTTNLADLYDVRALVLGESAVPVTLYTRRDETTFTQPFAPTTTSTTNESGAIAQVNSEFAPSTLQYFHREQDQTDQLGTSNYHLIQDNVTLHSGLRLAPRQRVDVDYIFDHVRENEGRFFSDTYDRHDGTVTHNIDFGKDAQHNLRSSFRFYDQSGRFDQQLFRLDENLTLRHTDRFETRYLLSADDQERSGVEQRDVRGSASLRHRLFESLTSSASVGASYLEIPSEFSSSDWFVGGTLDYTKKVSYGTLDASAGLQFDDENDSARGATVPVSNEAHIFRDPMPVVISRPNIVPASVVVTDASHLRVYIPGVDYDISAYPDRVELHIITGGAIIDGQTLLVSYDLGPQPAAEIGTTATSLSLRYTLGEGALRNLGFYGRYQQIDHSINTDRPDRLVLEDVKDLIYGIDYKRDPVTFLIERENRDSTTSPYDATRLEAQYNQRFNRFSDLSLDARYEIIDYTAENNRTDLAHIIGIFRHRFGEGLDVGLRLEYRDERDQVRGDVHGLEETLDITWHKRQTTVYGSIRNANLSGSRQSTDSQTLIFGVRRAF